MQKSIHYGHTTLAPLLKLRLTKLEELSSIFFIDKLSPMTNPEFEMSKVFFILIESLNFNVNLMNKNQSEPKHLRLSVI